jgi:hypothetical protein
MKYNHFSTLPIRAFSPRGKGPFAHGMTLEGGGGGIISDIVSSVSDAVSSVGQAVSDVAQTVSDVGVQIDKSVNDAVPGGWATVGAVVATVATMGAAAPLAEASVAADAAMAAETAGAVDAGVEAATIGADAAIQTGADVAVASGESTSLAAEVGSTVAETVPAADVAIPADFVGPTGIADIPAADAAASQAALQQAAEAAATGAAKGAGIAGVKDLVTTGNINPNDLLTGAVTGGVGGGIGNLAGGFAQGLASTPELGQYASTIGKAASGIAGGIAGGATGAEMTGRDPWTGAITGGISGLTGAAALGANTGLQTAGVDPMGAGFLTQTALGAGKAALSGGDPLAGALNSGVGAMLGTGLNAAGNAAYQDVKGAFPSFSDLTSGMSSSGPTTADVTTPTDVMLAANSGGSNANIFQSDNYKMAIALGYTPDQAVQYAQTLAADQASMNGPSPYAPLASNGDTPLVKVSPAPASSDTGASSAGSKDQLAADLAAGNITQDEYNKDMSVIDPSYVPPTAPDLTASSPSSISDLANAVASDTKPATTKPDITTPVNSSNPLGITQSESAADNPMKITNNPDGSVTVNENDGTQRVFTPAGSVISIAPDGTMTVDSPTQAAADAAAVQGSGVNLGSLASGLLGNILNNATGKGASLIPGIAGIGAGIAAAASQPAGWNPTEQVVPNSSLNWQSNPVVVGPTGESYGQTIIKPIKAAGGGLMSITPTVGQQGFNNLQDNNQDSTSAVQMYSHGGVIKAMRDHGVHPTKENMDTATHLMKGGAPAHQVMGFLKHRMAQGNQASHLGGYSDGGRMLKGPGDGMSDDIPATIGGKQPARLATDEFVVPADVVSHLGNGSSDAGAKVLYNMMDKIRKARTGTTKQGKQINPHKFMPKG